MAKRMNNWKDWGEMSQGRDQHEGHAEIQCCADLYGLYARSFACQTDLRYMELCHKESQSHSIPWGHVSFT